MSLGPSFCRLPLLLFHFTLPFPVLCCCLLRPCVRWFHSLLIPQFPSNPLPRPPHRLPAEVENWPRCNVLCDRTLPLQYICSHLLKPRLLHHCLQRWLFPDTTHLLLLLYPCNLPGASVMKNTQGPAHVGSHHPLLWPKQEDLLHHCLEKWLVLCETQGKNLHAKVHKNCPLRVLTSTICTMPRRSAPMEPTCLRSEGTIWWWFRRLSENHVRKRYSNSTNC